jgi:hypothetical protein
LTFQPSVALLAAALISSVPAVIAVADATVTESFHEARVPAPPRSNAIPAAPAMEPLTSLFMISFRGAAKLAGMIVVRVIGIQEAVCWFRVPAILWCLRKLRGLRSTSKFTVPVLTMEDSPQ